MISKDDHVFVIESADEFEKEVQSLRKSQKFMAFLAERSQEPARISLDELDREIGQDFVQESGAEES